MSTKMRCIACCARAAYRNARPLQRLGTVGGGGRNGGGRDAGYTTDTSLKGLELAVTMEDPKVFKAPLTARVTYRRVVTDWSESVCAGNPMEHYKDEWIGLPKADRPDF